MEGCRDVALQGVGIARYGALLLRGKEVDEGKAYPFGRGWFWATHLVGCHGEGKGRQLGLLREVKGQKGKRGKQAREGLRPVRRVRVCLEDKRGEKGVVVVEGGGEDHARPCVVRALSLWGRRQRQKEEKE
jgi:hypothetical protein